MLYQQTERAALENVNESKMHLSSSLGRSFRVFPKKDATLIDCNYLA